MTETEAVIVKKILNSLNSLPHTHAMKIHGDPYQERGLPDVLCCSHGHFFAFEVKRPDKLKRVSRYQEHKLKQIRGAGGDAHVISSPKEAVDIVRGDSDS
jgi:hypothetical protein